VSCRADGAGSVEADGVPSFATVRQNMECVEKTWDPFEPFCGIESHQISLWQDSQAVTLLRENATVGRSDESRWATWVHQAQCIAFRSSRAKAAPSPSCEKGKELLLLSDARIVDWIRSRLRICTFAERSKGCRQSLVTPPSIAGLTTPGLTRKSHLGPYGAP